MKKLLFALSISSALTAPALADCPNGHVPANTGINVISVTGGIGAFSIGGALPQGVLDSGPKTDANCYTAGALSIGGAPAVTAGAVVDDQGDDDPTNDVSHYFPPVTAVLGQNSTAIGNKATVGKVETYIDDKGDDDPTNDTEETRIVPVNNGTALGANTKVTGQNSTAIGAGAEANRDNEIVLGVGGTNPNGPTTIKASGITSDRALNRQTEGAIEIVTSDQAGHLATDGGSTFARLDDHEVAIASLNQRYTSLSGRVDEAFEGVAMALAMESPQVDPGKRFGLSLNVGTFEGESALAGAMRLRFDDTWSATGGVGYGLSSNTLGARAGIQAQW